MTYDVKNLPAMISLGKAGENAITEVVLDVSAWAKDYPKANFAIVVERSDGACYPVEITHSDGLISWLVTANETVKGYGKLEVRMLDGDVLAKSATTATYVSPSLDTGDTPEPTVPDWVNDLLQKIQDLIEHGVTPEQIEVAVTEYLDKHPIDAVTRKECEQIVADYVAEQGFPSFADIDREVEAYVTAHKDELKGKDGYTPVKGKDYFDGEDGYTPQKGKDYFDGKDGKTPVKGVDYFDGKDGKDYVITEADYSAIADVVLEKLPQAESEEF